MEFLINRIAAHPLELKYNKSLSQLGANIKSSIAVSDIEPNISVQIGDSADVLDRNIRYFFGMVTEVAKTDTKLSLTAYDHCYYLNKSKISIQFNDISVSDALTQLFRQCGMSVRHLPDMPARIDSVHYAQSPADIAKKLISTETDENGGEYYMLSSDINSVEIYKVGEQMLDVSLKAIIAPSKSATLDDVKNRVSIIVSDGNGQSVIETAQDYESIKKYGTLHEYISISSDASAKVGIAQNRLSQLKMLLAEGNITVSGDWRLTAVGKRIKVNEPISGLVGEYVITSVSHSLGDDFQTALGLREYISSPTSVKNKLLSGRPSDIGSISDSRYFSSVDLER